MNYERPKNTPKGFGIIPGSGAGFFSNFRGSVSAIKECEEKGLSPYFYWKGTPYDDASHGDNVWEYYFEQVNPLLFTAGKNLPRQMAQQDFSWRNLPETRAIMSRYIDKYVQVKMDIQKEVDDYYNENMKDRNVLGVHIRLTDKATHPAEKKTIVSLDNYKTEIQNYIDIFPEAYIYIATDSTDYLTELQREFGDKILLPDVIRSSGGNSIHHHSKGNGYQKGKDVLIECLLLSKCNFLIKGVSNVSLCALFFNKDLEHFNITSNYNGDIREDFIPWKKITEELCLPDQKVK